MSGAKRKGQRVTIRQVAKAAGIDPSVVSRVLLQDPNLRIRAETRQRVLNVVKELNYRPNAIARSLRTARAGAFGLLIPNFSNPVYATIVRGAEAAAAERRAVLMTATIRGPDSVERFLNVIGDERVDGVLIADARAAWPLIQPLSDLEVPYLLLNQRTENVNRYVLLDDTKAAEIAVDHLVSLGHVRIAHLSGPPDADTARRRLLGYRIALARHGIPFDPSLVVMGDYTYEGGEIGVRNLLGLASRPTAVFAANVASAIGCLYGAHEQGIHVPDDLSVVAVHDLDLARYLVPPLTTVSMPLEKLGSIGLDLLATSPPHARIEKVVGDDIRLIQRKSTAPPRHVV